MLSGPEHVLNNIMSNDNVKGSKRVIFLPAVAFVRQKQISNYMFRHCVCVCVWLVTLIWIVARHMKLCAPIRLLTLVQLCTDIIIYDWPSRKNLPTLIMHTCRLSVQRSWDAHARLTLRMCTSSFYHHTYTFVLGNKSLDMTWPYMYILYRESCLSWMR